MLLFLHFLVFWDCGVQHLFESRVALNPGIGGVRDVTQSAIVVHEQIQPEDHWSSIAYLSAEDMLKSEVIEEKKFIHSSWAGADNPLGPNFDVKRKASSLWSFVASLKRISSTSDFKHIFSWFNKCILPQVRGRQQQGTKFSCQQKPLVTSVICYKFKQNLFEVWFYTIFFMILYMYIAPGQGLTIPWGQIFM